jgi:hypothetical protein
LRHIAPPNFKVSLEKKLVAQELLEKERKEAKMQIDSMQSLKIDVRKQEHISRSNSPERAVLSNRMSVKKLTKMK